MITAYCTSGSPVPVSAEDIAREIPNQAVWIDLLSPSLQEVRQVEAFLGHSIPTREELKDIEPSSRLYIDNGAVFMTASVIWRVETGAPVLADIGFVLTSTRLVTIRYAEPRAFGLFIAAFHRQQDGALTASRVLARLLETISDRSAEILEIAEREVDLLSGEIFDDRQTEARQEANFLQTRLQEIGRYHRLVAKTRDSLASLGRLTAFLLTVPAVREQKDVKELCRTTSRDIQSLGEHAAFISTNIAFLHDASLGLINLEQNAIMKIVSIVSVVFLPPTLFASLYGMNFRIMPELDWTYGYPAALALMVVSAILPYLFFRWKGWL